MNGSAIPVTRVMASKIYDDGPLVLSEIHTDLITEKTGSAGVSIGSILKLDDMTEKTLGHGINGAGVTPIILSDNVLIGNSTRTEIAGLTYHMVEEYTVPEGYGEIMVRVKYTHNHWLNANGSASRVYLNDAPLGTEHIRPSGTTVTEFVEDLVIPITGTTRKIQIYAKTDGDYPDAMTINAFSICGTPASGSIEWS